MDDTSFGSIIRSLELGNIDNMPAHAGRSDKRTIGVILQLVARHRRHLLLLTSPMGGGGTGTIKSTVEVGSDDLAVVINLPIEHRSLCPGDTGIGNEDVEAAIEFFDDLVDHFLHVFGVGDVDLVGFAYGFDISAMGEWNRIGFFLHLTPYSFSISLARSRAFLLLLYQIATLAPDSASAWATARPIPAPAPETMAVLPLFEKRGRTFSVLGATVLSWVKSPPFIAESAMFARQREKCFEDEEDPSSTVSI